MVSINSAIDSGDMEQLMKALSSPSAKLPPVYDFAGSLYMEEFQNMKAEKQVSTISLNYNSEWNLSKSNTEYTENCYYLRMKCYVKISQFAVTVDILDFIRQLEERRVEWLFNCYLFALFHKSFLLCTNFMKWATRT